MLSLNPQFSPTWDEPIDMLFACHGKVKNFCKQLDRLPEYLSEHGVNASLKSTVQQICTYFNQAAPLHHEDEEENFFPTLLQYAPQANENIQKLLKQHQTLHDNWAALHAQLAALLADEHQNIDTDLIAQFTGGYAVHLALEEPLFYLGREYIPVAECQKIGKIMAARRQK